MSVRMPENLKRMAEIAAFFKTQDHLLHEADVYARAGNTAKAAEILAARQQLKKEFFEQQEG